MYPLLAYFHKVIKRNMKYFLVLLEYGYEDQVRIIIKTYILDRLTLLKEFSTIFKKSKFGKP